MDKQSSNEPIVCTLQPGELKARASELLPDAAALATNRTRTDNGLRLEFRATDNVLTTISAMISAERRCCRFLRFQLTVEPSDGPIVLELSGPAGTPEFLEAMLPSQ